MEANQNSIMEILDLDPVSATVDTILKKITCLKSDLHEITVDRDNLDKKHVNLEQENSKKSEEIEELKKRNRSRSRSKENSKKIRKLSNDFAELEIRHEAEINQLKRQILCKKPKKFTKIQRENENREMRKAKKNVRDELFKSKLNVKDLKNVPPRLMRIRKRIPPKKNWLRGLIKHMGWPFKQSKKNCKKPKPSRKLEK